MKYKKTFGEKLRERREELNMSQQELADRLNLNNSRVIGHWENDTNKPNLDKFEDLCKVLQVSPEYFIHTKYNKEALSSFEVNLLAKFKQLDQYGQNAVSLTLALERKRCIEQAEK